MTSVTLVHPEDSATIAIDHATTKCTLFQNNPHLTTYPYLVQSPVSLSIFREFITALKGTRINITALNLRGLELLCEEFGFSQFSAMLSRFRAPLEAPPAPQIDRLLDVLRRALLSESFMFLGNGFEIESEVSEAAGLFPAIREQLLVDSCARKFFLSNSEIEPSDICSLQLHLSGEKISNKQSEALLSNVLGNVVLERLFLNRLKSDVWMDPPELVMETRIDLESADVSVFSVEALDSLFLSESVSVSSEDALLQFVVELGPTYWGLLRHIQVRFLSVDGLSLLHEHYLLNEPFGISSESVWFSIGNRAANPPPRFDSRIFRNFPVIFANLEWKQCSLLWRGSRDGFGSKDFHRRCDDHANTLTVILDTKGNIFGGFTPLTWNSWVSNRRQPDESKYKKRDSNMKSFLFTLKNPHNIPPRRFALKFREKDQAISCYSERGPCFGYGPPDLMIYDECNTVHYNCTSLGGTYINDTGLSNNIVFTGSGGFQVEDIEVFKITKEHSAKGQKSKKMI
jgi:hypothetical protein